MPHIGGYRLIEIMKNIGVNRRKKKKKKMQNEAISDKIRHNWYFRGKFGNIGPNGAK